tara:strand:+ start:15803 stop:16171 length:369 start_codon:yes stop_codon:yes gene_type:complete
MDDLGFVNYLNDDDIEIDDDNNLEFSTYHTNIDIIKNYDTLRSSNITSNKITKYEKTKVLGVRAQMLASGAKPLIKVADHVDDVLDIAKLELKQKKIPFIIKRKISNNYEYWKLEDMIIDID